ncbi:coiled-coil domain-containing protein 13 isoform X3 [Hyperolius riggenbachi]|uniref:coiled-coil domain-containing protein 13 isoform X3 n=1 Tax=Hyperolius riggenbachi TaxID=752182 RepID=UPI0035A2A168
MDSDETVNENLRQQFKALQEQQQKRLQRLVERRKEKQVEHEQKKADAFGVDDKLNLLQLDRDCSSDLDKRLLEEENEQIQVQLRELRDENGRMHKLLKEKDFEIRHLRRKVEDDKLALAGTAGIAGDVAATKIVELSKKNRELTAELESERTKVKQLNNKVKELDRELQNTVRRLPQSLEKDLSNGSSVIRSMEVSPAESSEMKALQEKLSAANLKLSEYRNQIQSTKQELKMAHKVLVNEVGEEVNIAQLVASSGSWRGRSQQILALQGRVRELETQLGQVRSPTSELSLEEEMLGISVPRRLPAQEKNLFRLRTLEKERKESLEGQQKNLQEILGRLSQQEEKNKDSQHSLSLHLNNESQKQNSLVTQLKQMVAEREAKVKELEDEVQQLTTKSPKRHSSMKSVTMEESEDWVRTDGRVPARSPPGSGDHMGTARSARTVSKLGHELVEAAESQSPLIYMAGSPTSDCPVYCSSELRALQSQKAEFRALCQAAEVERDRLMELVSVLQRRVEEGNMKALEAEKKLQEERRRCVQLEQQLEKLRLEAGRNGATHKLSARGKVGQSLSNSRHLLSYNDTADPSSNVPMETQLEELNIKLEIKMDENEALKIALKSALKTKEDDLKLYNEMMKQVKQIFIQALRQHKQEQSAP